MEAPVTFAFKPTPESVAELDRLGDRIAELSAHLEVATGRLLILIREFDARQGWNTGFRSCAEWLAWRTNLELGAARERVRVARALGTLPVLSEALGRGDLSYAKVRALTRVARRPRAASWRSGGRGPRPRWSGSYGAGAGSTAEASVRRRPGCTNREGCVSPSGWRAMRAVW